MIELAMVAIALAFSFVNGLNDGGALLATGLKLEAANLASPLGTLTIAVIAAPLIVGTRVAETFADGLVDFAATPGTHLLIIAIVAAITVVLVLIRLGLPTSLTLATIGGIVGSGWGAGQPINTATLGRVLIIAAVAPLVGALLGAALSLLAQFIDAPRSSSRFLRRAHRVAFGAVSLAYGANDGQKMVAVVSVAAVVAPGDLSLVWLMLAVAVPFFLGCLMGLRRVARTLSSGVLAVRPLNAVAAEFAAATAVLSSAAIGAPVSMTQSIAGGLVGTGVRESVRKVRWRIAANMLVAWVVTLPAAAILAGAAAVVLRGRWS